VVVIVGRRVGVLTRRIGVECGVMALPCPPRIAGLLDFAGQANSVGGGQVQTRDEWTCHTE
jgi:hypothetical protein